METSGQRMIEAPKAQVWAALNDPAVIKACLPGCETLDVVSETEMAATTELEVGPARQIFACKLMLSDLDPPHGYTISCLGQAGQAGSVSAEAQVRLHDAGGGTKLTYSIRSNFEGDITSLGQEVLNNSAKRNADAFFDHFAAAIVQPAPAPVESKPQMYHLAHEDHDHDPTNPHYFGLPIGVILAGAVAVVSVGLVLAKFIF